MTEEHAAQRQHWVLVEGPGPGDAKFLGSWLLAAANADKLLEERFERDPKFKLSIETIELVYAFAFSPAATKFIELLMKNHTSFSFSLLEFWGDAFVIMTEIGLYTRIGDRYQMTLPKTVSQMAIKDALLRLAATEDDSHLVHPEHLVRCSKSARLGIGN